MKINLFITVYNTRMKRVNDISAELISKTIRDLINPIKYISFDNKLKLIDKTFNDIRESQHPTADRYRYFVINMISAYTNLECDVKGFDALSETKLLDYVINTFADEFAICNNLMQMCMADKEDG